jgi:hypothetical protein
VRVPLHSLLCVVCVPCVSVCVKVLCMCHVGVERRAWLHNLSTKSINDASHFALVNVDQSSLRYEAMVRWVYVRLCDCPTSNKWWRCCYWFRGACAFFICRCWTHACRVHVCFSWSMLRAWRDQLKTIRCRRQRPITSCNSLTNSHHSTRYSRGI